MHSQYRGIYGTTLRGTCWRAVNCILGLCTVLSCWAVDTSYMWSILIRSTAARQKKMFIRMYENRCTLQLATWRGREYFWQTHTNGTQCIQEQVCHSMNSFEQNGAKCSLTWSHGSRTTLEALNTTLLSKIFTYISVRDSSRDEMPYGLCWYKQTVLKYSQIIHGNEISTS